MMKFTGVSLFLTAVTLAFSSFANAEQLDEQRETYRKITQLTASAPNKATRLMIKHLLGEIKDYPLYPYAEYKFLEADKADLTFAEIEDYQRRTPLFSLADNLKRQWLEQRQTQRDWAMILDNAGKLPNDRASQCILWQAKTETDKTQEKPTALLQKELSKLWLTGSNLPKQCDPVLALWRKQGGLTNELIQQRALLALEQQNDGLILNLAKQTADGETRKWLNELHGLAKSPRKLFAKNGLFAIDKLAADNVSDRRILLAVYPNYLKSLKDYEIGDPDKLFGENSTHAALAKTFNLDAGLLKQWKKTVLTQIFDTDNTALQQWRDKELLNLKDDALSERRVRMAIREKADITPWLQALSGAAKNKEEWRYWQAQVLKKQGKTAQAEAILQGLQQKPRGFYPILAAAELGKAYQPEMHNLKPLKAENKTPTAAEKKSGVEQQYRTALQRINELRYFNDSQNMATEWAALLGNASFEQKLRLAEYAENQQWYDLQVEATIQAKAWSFIRLRLPDAYQDWFDLHLKDKKIDRTFAMAIARQESAWRPYVTSSANARGLMQLLPSTARVTAKNNGLPYHNESELFDPFVNIMLGTAHLQELYDKYGNNRILIAAAYNAGAHRVEQWLKKADGKLTMAEFVASIPFFETRGYVQNVLSYDVYYQILQGKPQQLFSQEEYNRLY